MEQVLRDPGTARHCVASPNVASGRAAERGPSDHEPDELPLLYPLADFGEADYSGHAWRDH